MSHPMFLLRVLVVLPVLAVPSCIPEDEPAPVRRIETIPPRPPPPPKPAFFKVEAKFSFDIPEKTAAQFALPAQFVGKLTIDLRAEALDSDPKRSRLIGKVDLSVTDPEGKRTYVTNSISVEGEADGKPSEAMGRGMERAAEAVNILFRSLPTRANDKPASTSTAPPGKGQTTTAGELPTFKGEAKIDMDLGL